MRILLLLAVCVAFVSASTLKFSQPLRNFDQEWHLYKSTFKKTYPTVVHENVRRKVWEQNLLYIHKHNLEADMNMHTYRLGVNEYADMTNEEYRKVLLGYRMNTTIPRGSAFLPPSNVDLPTTVDWRKKGYVTPVKNQGQCGSCWAFSTTGSLEGQHFRKTGRLVSLSEQNLVDCSRSFGNNGCNGGLMDRAFQYIKANGGIDTERSYPYDARDEPCHFKRATVGATDSGFVDILSGSEAHLKVASATVGPISVAIDASHPSFQLYKSGVYNEIQCSSVMLDHGVLVVGYGTFEGQDYWLVKNSWGPTWGLRGYIMMSRNKRNQCGIATQASYPLV